MRIGIYYKAYIKLEYTSRVIEHAHRIHYKSDTLENPFVADFLRKRPGLARTITDHRPILQLVKRTADELKCWRAYYPTFITQRAQINPDYIYPFLSPIMSESNTNFHEDLGLWTVRAAILSQISDI